MEENKNIAEGTVTDEDAFKGRLDTLESRIEKLVSYIESSPPEAKGLVTYDGGTSDKGIKSFSDWLLAVSRQDVKRLEGVYGSVKTMAEETGVTGGYLVPQQFASAILDYSVDQEVVFPRANKMPMNARSISIPALKVSGSYVTGQTQALGGMAVNWTEEAQKITNTQPNFRQIELVAHELSGVVPVSNTLLSDQAIGLEARLTSMFGDAISYVRDYAFLRGDGVAKPLGVLEADCTISAGDGTFDFDTVTAMVKRLHPDCMGTAVWVLNINMMDDLLSLQQTNNTLVTFLPNLRDRSPGTLMGMPVIFTDKLPTDGEGSILLADFRKYIIGQRMSSVEVAMSPHFRFDQNQTMWRVIYRVDGQPEWDGAFNYGPGTANSLSCFVTMSGS